MSSVATTTTTLTQMMKTYYDRKLLMYAEPFMVADKLAEHSRDIPKKEGKTVNFTRLVPLAKITIATTEGANPDYVEMEAFEFEKTTAKYSSSIRLTDTLLLTSYCKPLDDAVFLCGQNMGESVNYQYRLAMSLGFYPLRVDNSTTYAKTGTVTTSTSTTIIADTSLTEVDHFWVNGLLIWTTGQNAGSAHEVTAFAASGDAVTFTPALKDKADEGDKFRIVVTTGLAATNVVTCAAVERAVAILKNNKAPKFDGKFYKGIISPFVTYDFMQDSAWVNAKHYASPQDILNGELGKWGGVRWFEDTEAFTTLITDGTENDSSNLGFNCYSASGTINQTPIFGRHAIAGSRIKGVKDMVIVKVSGPQDTSNPTNAYSYVSWKVYFVAVVLNGLFGVQLLSGASTIA